MKTILLALAAATLWGASAIPFVASIKVGDKVSSGGAGRVSRLAGVVFQPLADVYTAPCHIGDVEN